MTDLDDKQSDASKRDGRRVSGEKPPPSSGSRFAFVGLIALAVLVAGLFFFTARTPPQRTITVSGRQIADELISFLRSLKEGNEFFGAVHCNGKNACERVDPDLLPVAAWQILGAAGIARLGDKDLAEEHADFYFEQWLGRADLNKEIFSLHQLYEGYLTIAKPVLFWGFWERIKSYVQRSELADQRGAPSQFGRMSTLNATMSRQFAQGASALRTPEQLRLLVEAGQFPGGKEEIATKERSFVRYGEQLADAAETLANGEDMGTLVDDPRLGLYACWPAWANLSLYEATGQEKYLAKVLSFLGATRFDERKPEEIKAWNLQAVLPCLEILIRLRKRGDSFRRGYRGLMENLVLKAWDYSKSPLCNGDGGFFSLPTKDEPCDENPKSVSDNDWLLFLVAQIPNETFTFLPKVAG